MNAWNPGTQIALLVIVFLVAKSGTAAALDLLKLAAQRWKPQHDERAARLLAGLLSVTGTTLAVLALAHWLN